MDCFVKDGVHLSPKGEQLFCHDIEAGVKAVCLDIKKEATDPRQDGFQKAGKKTSSSRMSPTRKDEQGFQPLGDDRNQRRNGDNNTGGWKDSRRTSWNPPNNWNDRRYNNRFQQDGNQDRRNGYHQNNYTNNTRQRTEHQNFNYNNGGNDRNRHLSDRQNGQYRQQTQHRQGGRTENRHQGMPDSVRDYLQRFMQNDYPRY